MQVERLLGDERTLYGIAPDEIAYLVAEKLRQLDTAGFNIASVTAIPDFHNYQRDGGVKDIFFLVDPKLPSDPYFDWRATLLRNRGSMHGYNSGDIADYLQSAIQELEQRGLTVRHTVAITDHHNFTGTQQGVGGRDGLKDMILCYHPRLSLPSSSKRHAFRS